MATMLNIFRNVVDQTIFCLGFLKRSLWRWQNIRNKENCMKTVALVARQAEKRTTNIRKLERGKAMINKPPPFLLSVISDQLFLIKSAIKKTIKTIKLRTTKRHICQYYFADADAISIILFFLNSSFMFI